MWMQVWKAEAESFRRQVWVRKYRDSGAEEEGRAEDRCHQETVSQMEEKKTAVWENTESQLSELNAKLQDRENQIHILEEKLKNLESSPQ